MAAYTHRRSRRARSLKITVYPDGSVVLVSPYRTPLYAVERFFRTKLSWIEKTREYFKKKSEGRIFLARNREEYLKLRDSVTFTIREKLEQYVSLYAFEFNRVSIKNASTRWGSCSRRKNLNFNYLVGKLPEPLLDYIVVHELCHLKEFNHSPKFWKLVSATIPDYRERRRELAKYHVKSSAV